MHPVTSCRILQSSTTGTGLCGLNSSFQEVELKLVFANARLLAKPCLACELRTCELLGLGSQLGDVRCGAEYKCRGPMPHSHRFRV